MDRFRRFLGLPDLASRVDHGSQSNSGCRGFERELSVPPFSLEGMLDFSWRKILYRKNPLLMSQERGQRLLNFR